MKEQIMQQIIEKQDELILCLDDMCFDTQPPKMAWNKRKKLFNELTSLKHQLAKYKDEKSDIINCICLFDDTATLEEKGRYFDVIQRDLRKLNKS